MSTLGSVSFWIDTGERVVRAYAQGMLTAWGLSLPFLGGLSVPFKLVLFAGGVFALLSLVTCLASLAAPKADKDTGSFLAIPPYQLIRLRAWLQRHR